MNIEKIYRIGMIGAGMIARVHIANLQKTGRVRMTWIAARNPENLEQVRREFEIPRKTHDYREVLEDPEVDAVVITTPPNQHLEMFTRAIEAGKHVLLEKPMAMSLEEVETMLELKSRHPELAAMECSGRHARLIPKYGLVREIISSGELGDIYHIHHNSIWRQNRPGIEYHPRAKWFLDRKIAGGGPLFDWGVYDLSFHLGVLGDRHRLEEIGSVWLKSGLDEVDPGTDIYDVEEHFVVNMQLSEGITCYWERGNHANVEVPNETRIYGTRGGLKFGYCSWDGPVIIHYYLDDRGKARERKIGVDAVDHDDGLALSQHLVAVLDGREEPVIPLETAGKHLQMIFALYRHADKNAD